MPYLNNAWYVAAWANEIGSTFFTRTLLDTPVVFFRSGAKLVAMHDQCPHRFAPLSRGTLIDGEVRCGYHGLFFDTEGRCTRSVFSPVAPKAAKVRTFQTFEQDGLVWIWMGDQPPASVSEIPQLSFHTDSQMRCQFGYTHAKADYRLLSDNLMDLTHTALLHPSFGGLDYLPAYKCWEEDGDVVSQYIIEHMPSFLDPTRSSYLHNHDKIRWKAPATHILDSRITPEDGQNQTVHIPSAHILTPETATSTHYFWSSASPADTGASDEEMRALLVQAFDHEDKPMIEAVQQRMGDRDLWDLNPILLSADAGSVRVRRRLSTLIDAEQKGSPPTTAGKES